MVRLPVLDLRSRPAATIRAASARAASARGVPPPLLLLPGEWVEVQSEEAIAETLDDQGTLDALPFMPEMREYCGRRFRVKARADRTVADGVHMRSMDDAVHLDGVRCDGAAHDACRRGCLIFWKEAWLRRAPPSKSAPTPEARAPSPSLVTRRGDRYFCQSTELARATRHLQAWKLHRHAVALFTEDVSPLDLLHAMGIFAYNVFAHRIDPRWEWAVVSGPCKKTPSTSLGLAAGDRVRVKREPEIRATLDENGWNRKMEFSREMLRFCGREATVLGRMDRLIFGPSGKMVELKNTVILDGFVYKHMSQLAAPRAEYVLWRECWLERV
jgi:hypothetical protein